MKNIFNFFNLKTFNFCGFRSIRTLNKNIPIKQKIEEIYKDEELKYLKKLYAHFEERKDLYEDEASKIYQNSKNKNAYQDWIKRKIIEKKYFRKKPEINLLIYDAKQQIRHLFYKNPEIWSVSRLAENYLISDEEVGKILRSNFRLTTIEKIHKHDARVIKNFEKLKNKKSGGVLSKYLYCNQLIHKQNFGKITSKFNKQKKIFGDFEKLYSLHENQMEPFKQKQIFDNLKFEIEKKK